MSKHLQTVVKECRYILEKDFVQQVTREEEPWQMTETSGDPEDIAKEAALKFVLEIAAVRCFEEQVWKIPTRLTFSSDIARKLFVSRRSLRAEFSFPLRLFLPSPQLPKDSSLKTVLRQFGRSIASDEWHAENVLGWIYQYFHENTPEQKLHGKFYTPESIAEYIVSQTLRMVLTDGGLPAFSLLDLASGSGAFALRVFEHMYECYQQSGRVANELSAPSKNGRLASVSQRILENHLYLIDNDPWACEIAAINLCLKAKVLEPTCHIRTMNIFCADALRKWEDRPETQTTYWRKIAPGHGEGSGSFEELTHVFTRKYDVVVGNPPYIVINQLQTSKELIRLYKSYHSAAFKINIFALFIERGIALLKPDGVLGMIVPNTLLTQVYFEPLRKFILSTSTIRQILDTKRMFDSASVENCIVLLQSERNARQRHENMIECRVKNVNQQVSRKRIGEPETIQSPVRIPQRHFEQAPFKMFNVHIDEPTFTLMQKIAQGNSKLGEICESHDGVNPGNAKHKLIVTKKFDETCKKILNGKNIERYWLAWGGLYVRYNRNLLVKGDNVRWGHPPSLNSAKILTRQTADRIIGTFEHGEYYTTNSIHTTILRDGLEKAFHLKYLLALLNSKLLSFYYRKLIAEAGQLFAQVKLVNLRQIPVKHIPLKEQQSFIRCVDTILQLSSQPSPAKDHRNDQHVVQDPLPETLEIVNCREARLCKLRAKDDFLDQRMYALYRLTSEEIHLIEREMGAAITGYPRPLIEELSKKISFETFQKHYCRHARTIFQMAEQYQVHPETILELRKQYHLFRE